MPVSGGTLSGDASPERQPQTVRAFAHQGRGSHTQDRVLILLLWLDHNIRERGETGESDHLYRAVLWRVWLGG
jgi:hypothetical protein